MLSRALGPLLQATLERCPVTLALPLNRVRGDLPYWVVQVRHALAQETPIKPREPGRAGVEPPYPNKLPRRRRTHNYYQ